MKYYIATYALPEEFQKKYEPTTRSIVTIIALDRITSYNVCYTKLLRKVNTKRPSGFSGQQPDLDYEFLEELYGNDMEYASQMMQLFIESLPDQLAQLEEAAMRENYSVIQELSHKIKPTFSMVGLTALNKKALDIETKAKARTDIKSLKSEVFDFYQETLVKMSQIISDVITSYSIHYTKLYECIRRPEESYMPKNH